jgi:NitT/TauT family transport system substrate-binding protein
VLSFARFPAWITTALLLVAVLTQSALAADAPVPVRVALFPTEGSGQVYYAIEEGYFAKAGLDVQLVELKNGAAIAAGVAGGSADVGLSNVVSLAIAHERGLPFQIIASGGLAIKGMATNGILAVAATSPIKSAKDLNGKTIAVDVLGGLPYLAGKAWIDQNGGDSKTVKYVELGFPEMEASVTAGRIDAASINSSVDPTINKPGDPLRTLAIVYDAVAPRFAASVWFSTTDWTTQHPDATRKFVAAMRQAGAWANTHHHESAAILAKYIKQPAEQIEGGPRVTYATDNDPAQYQALIDLGAKYGALKADFPAREITVH